MRRRFGFVFQHSALLDWLTVAENVAFPLVEGRHESRRAVRGRIDEVLERLDLATLRDRLPAELSAGERKRVALARAIIVRPDVLIYDEPTTGQDPQRTYEIDNLIVQTQQRFDVTSIVISHDMPATFRIAHAIALVRDGTIAAYGTPAELAASTDAYVQHFIEASAA
jgi:ABC-type transporter Mla maintaining outer membrane lipid asymmetry ATPase subunit MlaF